MTINPEKLISDKIWLLTELGVETLNTKKNSYEA